MEITYILILVLLGTAIGSSVGMVAFLSEVKERNERPKELANFREDLTKALSHEDVTWSRVRSLARTHDVNTVGLKHSLESLLSRVITGEMDETPSTFLDRIEDFLKQLESEEPFQGLPKDIQLHLKRLDENLPSNNHLLQPLTQHLKQQMQEQSAQRKREKWISSASLFVGVGGLLVGLITVIS